MNTVNTNDDKIKYLTYEDVREEYETIKNVESFCITTPHRAIYNNKELMGISEETSQNLFKEVLKIPSDSYLDIILDFANLVDTNEKYIIIDSLLSIFYADINLFGFPESPVDLETKQTLLSSTLKLLKSIKDSNSVIKSFVGKSKNSLELAFVLLNKKTLCNELLENKEFLKQAKNYDKVLDLFPQIKNNER